MLNPFNLMFHGKHFFGLDATELPSGGPVPAAPASPAPAVAAPAASPAPASPAAPAEPDFASLKPDEIKELLEKAKPVAANPASPAPASPAAPAADDRSKWFDPVKGFRTKEDADKSYTELQEAHRQKSEKLKEYEQREAMIAQQQEQLRQAAAAKPLSVEDQQKQAALEKWKLENADALNFIKEEIKKDMAQADNQNAFARAAMEARKTWKEGFDKEESRKVLWPIMDAIYKEKDVFEDFTKNPLPYIEAVAFQKNFGVIAQKIKDEAIANYKATLSQASEAERRNLTAIPGGPKMAAGEIDLGKASSSEIANLLPRNENG